MFMTLFTIVGFFILFLLLPPAGDDFIFKTPNSLVSFLERQIHYYNTENGRILGNSLIYALVDFRLLSSGFKAIVIWGIIYNIISLLEKKYLLLDYMCVGLIIVIPASLFSQTYAWNAGFYNYVPPVLLFMYALRKLFSVFNSNTKLSMYDNIFLFLSGFCGSLFVEFCTTYAVVLSMVIMLLFYVRYHKLSLSLLGYAGGTLAGAVLMFSSPVYHNVVNNSDQYRTMALSLSDVLYQARSNYSIVSTNTIGGNFLLYLLLSIICICIIFMRKLINFKEKVLIGCFSVIPIYFFLSRWLLCVNFSINDSLHAFVVDIFVCMMFYIALFYVVLQYLTSVNQKWICSCLLLSVLILNGPLLIVTPIGPRCFFASYIFLVALILQLMECLIEFQEYEDSFINLIVIIYACIAMIVYIFIAFHQYRTHSQKCEYIEEQMLLKKQTIDIPKYEYPDFIHEPETKKLGYLYYYEVPWDIEWNYIPYKEWYSMYYNQ